jgi:SAM-dependent methyltransferase
MPHIFDPKFSDVLESDERKKMLPAEPVIELAKSLERRDVAFDIGAGTGYFTVPLSEVFKKVYAVDISFEMAKKLREKLDSMKLSNVGIIISEEPPEIDFRSNMTLFSNVLHEMNEPERYLNWARNNSDYVFILEWKKIKTDFGPPLEERISEEEMLELLKKLNFDILKFDTLTYRFHYLIVARSNFDNCFEG